MDKESDEKEHQIDKAGEYVRELLQEKLELDNQKSPIALRLLDQGKRIRSFLLIVLLAREISLSPMEDPIELPRIILAPDISITGKNLIRNEISLNSYIFMLSNIWVFYIM